MYLKNVEKSSIEKIKFFLINIDSYDRYLLDNLFVSYLKKYNHNTRFEDTSFIYNENGNQTFCPITIEKKNNKKYLSYLGNPIKIFSHQETNSDYKNNFLKSLHEFSKKLNVEDISLCLEIKKKIMKIICQTIKTR